jgi:hypothetical protein
MPAMIATALGCPGRRTAAHAPNRPPEAAATVRRTKHVWSRPNLSRPG